MNYRPILFSAPMVRATLAGTKTQTRRVAKHPLAIAAKKILSYKGQTEFDCILADDSGGIIHCPQGKPGDSRLWVREAWRASSAHDDLPPRSIPVGDAIEFAADGQGYLTGKLRPSMFMPRWASRITLEVTGVRVERLQDISEADCIAEGVVFDPGEGGIYWVPGLTGCSSDSAADAYRKLWESINGPGSWEANPWVWVVAFKRLKGGAA